MCCAPRWTLLKGARPCTPWRPNRGQGMDAAISPATIGLLVAALVIAGVVTGFLAGLLGIGGGGIVAPVLYEVFGIIGVDPAVRMHLAVGTSLAVMVPTTIRSFAAHN